jgi:predicted dehydrogenase
MSQTVCRWGILGAADIARKNWQAIRNAANCTLTAIAAREPQRCREYVAACQRHTPFEHPPKIHETYESLLASDEVDAVYIPLPTGVRKAWALRAAEAGKHVLIEKPAGVNADEVREILDACRANRVQFMDGVMFMHSRRLDAMRAVLDDGRSVGRVKRISTEFSFGAPEEFFQGDIRTNSRLEPLGCLGDLGWYNLRFILWVMNEQLPLAVCGHMLSEHRRSDSPDPVPTDFSAELFYPNGVSANLYCSFRSGIQQWAVVSGTHGAVYVPDFVLPHYGSEAGFAVSNPVFQVTGCDFNMERHTRHVAVHEYSNSAENAQETAMFRKFAELVLAGSPDPYWGESSWKTQRVLDACLLSARSQGRRTDVTV